jgi:hypothetical protein
MLRTLLALLALTVASCGNPRSSEREHQATDTGDYYVLNQDEFLRVADQANMNDASSSFKLYMHLTSGGENYGPTQQDDVYWRDKAAEQGDERAQQHLLVMALTEGTPQGCASARRIIETFELASKIRNGQVRVTEQDLANCGL